MSNKKILLFPGQGSQSPGMLRELAEKFGSSPKIKAVFECGADILGYDLKSLLFTQDDGESTQASAKLADTLYAQPAIFAASLVSLYSMQIAGQASRFLTGEYNDSAGHSLGEYAALVSCGVLDMESGFKAIKVRAEIMSRAGKTNPGGMTAIIGLSHQQVTAICDKLRIMGFFATLANFNSPLQCVIAGEEAALAKAEILAKKVPDAPRVKCVRLKVSGAFHTKLMNAASEEFKEAISGISFAEPKANFYSNVTGGRIEHINADYLAMHIVSPVMFAAQLKKIHSKGYSTYIETGPGKILSGLVGKTLVNVKTYNVEDEASLARTIEEA
ncbi:MAG: ACP S-malonyltransferase [Oscillospiraceae bacterium]|nr:ACP S-malonyltransferase [Oscillospiraceae bacterium]